MSFIVHTIVKNGIIASSDTRRTVRNRNKVDGTEAVHYDDTSIKIFPFPNNIVVSTCGDSIISHHDNLDVDDFLFDLRNKRGKDETIKTLPLAVLSEVLLKSDADLDTVFLISGYDELMLSYTYMVDTMNREIKLLHSPNEFVPVFDGAGIKIAKAFMDEICYDQLSFKEGIELTESCVRSIIEAYRYRPQQKVGGYINTYVISRSSCPSGWYKNGEIVSIKE